MPGDQDPTRRFDYLFEPLDGAEADGAGVPAPDHSDADNRRSGTAAIRIGIAAVICATIAVAVATVLLLL